MYKNYVFDLYGTLVDIHTDEEKKEVWGKLSLFYGYYGARYTPKELYAAYKSLVKDAENAGGSHEAYPEIQIETVFAKLFEEKGVQVGDALALYAGQFFRALSTEYIRLYEGAIGLLEGLHGQGKKVYLLSNAQRIFTEYELQMLDVARCFDGILISSDFGVKKPDQKFFEILLEKYALNPQECIMIGNDQYSDIAGARGVGMDTYYIHSNLSPDMDGEISATYVQKKMDLKETARRLEIKINGKRNRV